MINESKEEVEYLMSKFYEYRILASEAGANGSDDEYKKFSEQAMEYYERAIAEMDADAADMTDHLSDEDKALPNKPLDEEFKRFQKLAGINEGIDAASLVGKYIDLSQNVGMSGYFPKTAQDVIDIMPKFQTPGFGIKVYDTDPGKANWGSGIYFVQPDGTLKYVRDNYDTSG